MKLILAITLLISTSAAPAQAATYWVSTNGSDSNRCTHSARPLTTTAKLTVSAGVACAAAGDTVFIRAGTYGGDRNRIKSDVYTVNSGASWSRPITIAAYTGETVIIPYIAFPANVRYVILDRLIVDAYGLNNNPIFIGCGSHHIRFQNGVLKNSTGPNASQGALIIGSDNEILNSLIDNNGDDTILEGGEQGIYVKGDRNLIEGNEIIGSGWGAIQVYDSDGTCDIGADFNIIRGNRIHNNHRNSPGHSALTIGSGDGNIAVNNVIYNENGTGIGVNYNAARNTLVYNNTIYDMEDYCIYIGKVSADAIVKNNIAYDCDDGAILNEGGGDTVQSHNLTTLPAFTNASENDFTLVCATSVARNAGTNVTAAGVTTDYSGTARPQGPAFDIGAYECVEGAGKATPSRKGAGRGFIRRSGGTAGSTAIDGEL